MFGLFFGDAKRPWETDAQYEARMRARQARRQDRQEWKQRNPEEHQKWRKGRGWKKGHHRPWESKEEYKERKKERKQRRKEYRKQRREWRKENPEEYRKWRESQRANKGRKHGHRWAPKGPPTAKTQAAKAQATGLPPGWRAKCGAGVVGVPLPPGFDPAKYIAKNPDVAPLARRKHGAAMHYSCRGAAEGRQFAGYSRPGYLGGIFANWDQQD